MGVFQKQLLILAVLLHLPLAVAGEEAPQTVLELREKPFLLLDSGLIAAKDNVLERSILPVREKANPVLPADKPWEGPMVIFPSVLRIDNEWKMWYVAWGNNFPARRGELPIEDASFLCYATSSDGIHWKKPSLGLTTFRGSTDNNIVLRSDGSHINSFSVMHLPGQEWPYVMVAFQGTWPYETKLIEKAGYKFGIPDMGHYAFRSRDGLHWESFTEKKVSIYRAMDRSLVGYDPAKGRFMGFWKLVLGDVRIRHQAFSKDLVHWTNSQVVLLPDSQSHTKAINELPPESLKQPEQYVSKERHHYCHFMFPYGNGYLGLLELLNESTMKMSIELLHSRTLDEFQRFSDEPFIAPGGTDTWDGGGILMIAGTPPVEYENRLYFYYCGANFDHRHGSDLLKKKRPDGRWEIGLVYVDRDRFVVLAPDDKSRPAVITTVPLRCSGKQLVLNADAQEGEVRIELLDTKGKPLKGFRADDCIALRGESKLDWDVRWKTASPLPVEPVQVRIELQRAGVYSIRCTEGS